MLAIVKLLGGWRASIFAVLAVAAVIGCLSLRGGLANASLRADAAEQRAEALQGELKAAKSALDRDSRSADATNQARQSAQERQPVQEARAAKVKSYADSAVSHCAADLRIVRELREGTDRFRAGEARLRGHGQPEGKTTDPADD